MRSLHQLGKCYLLPGVDFVNYTFAGNAMPRKAEYDNVGRLCARVGVQDNEDSSATVSSSSSSEVTLTLEVCRCKKHFPPTIAAALQSCPGRVWTPELVRDQAVARLRESALYVIHF